MQSIEIDFEVFKALTAQREVESDTYNDVIRRLLGLDSKNANLSPLTGDGPGEGFALRGLTLPNGTKLRVGYKGQLHTAEIRDGRWIDEHGVEHQSPSAAASSITQTNVNGWRFWEVKRPSDTDWRKLDSLQRVRLL